MFEILFSILGYHKTDHHLFPLNVAGISEGKEELFYRLIILMYGTHDHPDETPQSIVNDTCTVTHGETSQPSYAFSCKQQLFKYLCEPGSNWVFYKNSCAQLLGKTWLFICVGVKPPFLKSWICHFAYF